MVVHNTIAAARKVLSELKQGKKVSSARLMAAVLAFGAALATSTMRNKFLKETNDVLTVAASRFGG